MPDFKGRKDFPEVDDKKIKIGDYSGTNRLSVIDIFSPKEKPELRDQMIEPVKGNKANNYDSPMLSQQPVIVLSDDESEEATLIKAIIDDVEDAALIKAIEALEKVKFSNGPSVTDQADYFQPGSERGQHQAHDKRVTSNLATTLKRENPYVIGTEKWQVPKSAGSGTQAPDSASRHWKEAKSERGTQDMLAGEVVRRRPAAPTPAPAAPAPTPATPSQAAGNVQTDSGFKQGFKSKGAAPTNNTIDKAFGGAGRRHGGGGGSSAPVAREGFRNSPMDTGGDARRADAAVDAELAALKTKHSPRPDRITSVPPISVRPKGQEYGMPGPSATGTAPKTHAEAAERTRRPAGVEWGQAGKPAVESVSKARRPIPDDRGPKDAPWDDRGRPKHPGAPERPHPEPEYPGPREKRDPMPGERKRDWTLGKAGGDPKVHISSDKAQQQIEEYLASHGPKQSKMGHGVDTETGEQHLYPDPKVSSKSGRRIQKNLKKEFSGVEKGTTASGAPGGKFTSVTPSSRLKGNRNKPGSIPTQGWSKSADIDVSLLKDIADLLEKQKVFGGLGGVIKPSVPETKTASPSIYTQKPRETTPKPGGLKSEFTGFESAPKPPETSKPAEAPATPAPAPATPWKSKYMKDLTAPGSTQQWGKPGPSAPAATPDASAATPDAPAATGGKMQGAGKRVGAGVKDFGTGFGEGFSGGTSDGGSGTGVNINVGGGGGSTTASGGGGGPSAPADTSADDDAGVATSVAETGESYTGEPATAPSTPSAPPEQSGGVQRGTAPTQPSAKAGKDAEIEQIMAETGFTAEQVEEAQKTPDKPGIPNRLAQAVKGAAKGAGRKVAAAGLGAAAKGLDRAASSRFAFADVSEEEEEAVKSWTYSG